MSHPVAPDEIPAVHQPYDPDDISAFHAARLLLLVHVCGDGVRNPAVEGSTKLAKLDFFVRYPKFLERAHVELVARGEELSEPYVVERGAAVEAPMIRYRFGPWDPRYRQYIAFLESRGLASIGEGARKAKRVALTTAGRRLAEAVEQEPAYAPLVDRARAMKDNLAGWSGTELKDFIYELLVDEVANRSLRETIQ